MVFVVVAFNTAGGFGDPHFLSLDGKDYTFNGLGEYTLLNGLDGRFILQGRTKKTASPSGDASVGTELSAIVAKAWNSDTVQIQTHQFRKVDALINGQLISFDFIQIHSKSNVTLTQGSNKGEINVTFSDVSLSVRVLSGMIRLMMSISPKYRNKTQGLLGVWNGNPDDDLRAKGGRVLPATATATEIHEEFGQTCQ